MTHHSVLQNLNDRVTLLGLEPGVMSQQKQAYEILMQLQAMPKDELAADDVELYEALTKSVKGYMGLG